MHGQHIKRRFVLPVHNVKDADRPDPDAVHCGYSGLLEKITDQVVFRPGKSVVAAQFIVFLLGLFVTGRHSIYPRKPRNSTGSNSYKFTPSHIRIVSFQVVSFCLPPCRFSHTIPELPKPVNL
jgi:hypothetical protein